MPASRIHLIRHGEVHNPRRVLYERIAGYRLSEAGRLMARVAAEHVQSLGRPVSALVCSPLERTRESAEPFAEIFGAVKGDFYAIDRMLFSPAKVTVTALKSGQSFQTGHIDTAVLARSFA